MIELISQSELDSYIQSQLALISAEFQLFLPELAELTLLYSKLNAANSGLEFSSNRKHPGFPIPLMQIRVIRSGELYEFNYWSANDYSDHIQVQKWHGAAREYLQHLIQLRRRE